MIPAHWEIRTYTGQTGAVAHVFESRKDKRGNVGWHMLPATEFADGPAVAAERLTAFLNDEIAKAAAQKARGALLGASNRKVVA